MRQARKGAIWSRSDSSKSSDLAEYESAQGASRLSSIVLRPSESTKRFWPSCGPDSNASVTKSIDTTRKDGAPHAEDAEETSGLEY
jgi:hypothetical protein